MQNKESLDLKSIIQFHNHSAHRFVGCRLIIPATFHLLDREKLI